MGQIDELDGGRRQWILGLTNDIGRDPGCTIVLEDPFASGNHAEIQRTANGQFRIVDLGSRHGTFVGTARVREHLLSHGEEITIGTTRLRFTALDQASPSAPVPSSLLPSAALKESQAVEDVRVAFPSADEQPSPARLKQDYERLRAAYFVGQRLSLSGGVDGLLEAIGDVAIELLHADRVAILLKSPETEETELRLVRAREGQRSDVHVSQSILREVLGRRVGILSADAGADERFGGARSILASSIRSAMCVPLLHRGEVLGAIHCDTRLATGVFQEADLELFTTIASQAAVAVRNAMLVQRLQEETSTRVQLQRFFSPGVVEQIVGGNLRVSQKGEMREVSVFFLDIRGFTRMSEGMDPKDIVSLLNAFFTRMVPILFEHDGTLDKYVGDELMALFGTPVQLDDAPFAAVACAAAMRDALVAFNVAQTEAGGPSLAVGVGIHSGPALCGIIGSPRTRQYTAMGDTVNTASRLCSVAKADQILIGRSTYDAVRDRVEAEVLAPITVKGKRKPLEVFDVRRVRGTTGGVAQPQP